MTPERIFELVLTIKKLDNEELEQMMNKIRKGEKIIQQQEQTIKMNRKIMNLNQKQRNEKKTF